jgi:hypothetical protein
MKRALIAASVVLAVSLSIARCTSTPSALGSATVAEYCAALANYTNGCNIDDPCTVATVKHCPAIAATYSSAALGALTTCLDGVSCGDAGAAAEAVCAQYWLAALTPSDAQAKLAQDYCATCPATAQTAAECASAFYAAVDDGGSVIVPGAGYLLLPSSDTLVASATTLCVPALVDAGDAGCATFSACELQAVAIATPAPPACTSDASAEDDAAAD